ncbi:hypothetical protein VaNZ11_009625 [Volvox africanus]|uniref:Plastid division protein CDP1-like 2nd alpha solenoid domain-containing protein n=1 Tax=Volvox africanus TaxID=51714 RepID=A0ABQ5S946_9CHLO|nr:hypothetical protein VaNZ11_009625 [Volvox africanus]
MLSQRNLSAAAEPYLGTAHWRYRAIPTRPLVSCAAHRTAGAVTNGLDVFSRTGDAANANVAYSVKLDAEHAFATDENRCIVNNGPPEAPTQHLQLESSVLLHQQEVMGQCYSPTTVSAMARLLGHHDGQELSIDAGQASVVVLPKAHLLSILKAGSGTPLDEASAALALLCEAGQYDIVVQYGSPLLKAASAAMPFSPLGVSRQQPVPHLEQLTADLALSIALAYISLAGGGGGPAGAASSASVSSGGSSGPIPAATEANTGGAALTLMDMEEVFSHLESALQVLERHCVAPPLQKEVAYCLQGVAVAFAEDVLRSTPPVLQLSPAAAPPSAPGATPALTQRKGGDGEVVDGNVGWGAVADSSGRPAGVGKETVTSSLSSSVATAAAARRTKAVCMLRSVLWRCAPQNQSNQHSQDRHQQHRGDTAPGVTQGSVTAAGSAPVVGAVIAELRNGPPAASSGDSRGWVPELTPDERSELIAPLRGLLAASEHIALYGPVASGQKPYGAVQLSDQELYDLAIAHLAQGVSTGWPQHVLQALSYFERVAQQQQQYGLSGAAGLRALAAATAAAADVSFERSVCEALLGRRTTAAGPVDLPPPASSTAMSAPPSGTAAAAAGSVATESPHYNAFGAESANDGDELALLRRLEAQLILAAGGGGGGASGAAAGLNGASSDAVSFEVKERVGDGVSDEEGAAQEGLAAPRDVAAAAAAKTAKNAFGVTPAATMAGSRTVPNASAAGATATATTMAATGPPSSSSGIRGSTASPGGQCQHQQHTASENLGVRPRVKADRVDDVARKYGWAESWLELSVMPCFPETAGAGSVSLARWFSDPRVILFNKLLAVRSGAEVTAALGSAVAHVSDASRQRLWQLWQAAAQAVGSATGQSAHHHQLQHQPAVVATASLKAPAASEAVVVAAVAGGGGEHKGAGGGGIGGAPLAGVLWAQSHAALQDVGPRAAAAASAMAAAAAAVGSAAVSSPRAVAAAAKSIVPFGLARWGSSEGPRSPNSNGGGRIAVTAQALPQTVATAATTASVVGRSIVTEASGGSGSGVAIPTSTPTTVIPAVLPVAGELVDVGMAPPPAGGGGSGAAAVGTADAANITGTADTASSSALWAPDAEGHLHPRPRMVTRVVMQRAAEAAASIKDRVAILPVAPRDWRIAGWDPAAVDEAMSREAVRRVAAVAAQAICLGALAAYVGNRILARGALQATAASGYGAAAAAVAPTVDASTAQVAAAARAVARWLDSAGMGGAAQDALGRWPTVVKLGGWPPAEALPLHVQPASAESLARLAEQYGRGTQLDETAAAALLRGWSAARAAAPSLSDPRDRSELLSGLLGGRALRVARAEAERNARMGKRVQVQRIDVEIEQLRFRPASAQAATSFFYGHSQAGAAETTVTAVVVTAGTETNRASSVPLSYCSRERLTLTFRRLPLEGGPAATPAAPASVWRLVDVRDAPPAVLY